MSLFQAWAALAAQNGKKLVTGTVTPVSAAETVVTGLSYVDQAMVIPDSVPVLTNMWIIASPGNQAGAPAAGSIIIASQKPTGAGDVTPIAATTFRKVHWAAIGD